jgi:hypothetical protein
MTPGTNGSSAGSPKTTYAIINQGASANMFGMILKPCDGQLNPVNTTYHFIPTTLIKVSSVCPQIAPHPGHIVHQL